MDKLREVIAKKPTVYISITFFYLALVSLLKWFTIRDMQVLWYMFGGILGLYFLDIAEEYFRLSPSPFRSLFFAFLIAVVTIFVVTSVGSLFASGLVLSIYLQLIFYELEKRQMQQQVRMLYIAMGLVATYFFIA